MAKAVINLQKESGGVLSVSFPDGGNNTELVLPESGKSIPEEVLTKRTEARELIALLKQN